MGKHRALMKMELLVALAKYGNTDNVRRQQVRGELNPFELGVDRARESLRECGFARAWEILQQDMPTTGQRRHQAAGGLGLALHDLGDVCGNPLIHIPASLVVVDSQ